MKPLRACDGVQPSVPRSEREQPGHAAGPSQSGKHKAGSEHTSDYVEGRMKQSPGNYAMSANVPAAIWTCRSNSRGWRLFLTIGRPADLQVSMFPSRM
jgi:hypothetical protein